MVPSTPDLSPEFAVLLEARDTFLGFLQRQTGSAELAEDILQGAYAKSLETIGTLRDGESVVAWFYRVLRNAVIDRSRRRGAGARALERFANELETREEPGGELLQRVCACVNGALEDLKPEYRAAITAIDLGEQDLKGFAAAARITTNNAGVRLHRAREALARRLRDTCGACAAHRCIDCTCKHT